MCFVGSIGVDTDVSAILLCLLRCVYRTLGLYEHAVGMPIELRKKRMWLSLETKGCEHSRKADNKPASDQRRPIDLTSQRKFAVTSKSGRAHLRLVTAAPDCDSHWY